MVTINRDFVEVLTILFGALGKLWDSGSRRPTCNINNAPCSGFVTKKETKGLGAFRPELFQSSLLIKFLIDH